MGGLACVNAAAQPAGDPEGFSCARQAASQQLVARLSADGRPAKLLLLSGGGWYGAWGAGVLNATHGSLGKIDVLTGVSTGALASTFVYLALRSQDPEARAAYWDRLTRLYTETTSKDIYRRRWALAALFGDAIYSTKPLRKKLQDELPQALLEEVAAIAGAPDAPLLCVGTVNLSTGRFEEWDLGAIAKAGKFDLYRDVVQASAAIPVVFQPVRLLGDLHVDGGTRKNVFARTLAQAVAASGVVAARTRSAAPLQSLSADQQASVLAASAATVKAVSDDFVERGFVNAELRELIQALAEEDRPTAHVLINGLWDAKPRASVKRNLLAIGQRSLELLTAARMTGNVYELLYLLDGLGSREGEPVYKLRFSWIPDSVVLPEDCGGLDFEPTCMKPLYQAAVSKGDDAWEDEPPRL